MALASIAVAQAESVAAFTTSSVPSPAPINVNALPSAPAVKAVVNVAGPVTWIQQYSDVAGADWRTPAPTLAVSLTSEVTTVVAPAEVPLGA